MENATIEIPLSKAKIIFIILGCLLFVVLGVFMILNAEDMQTRKYNSIWIIGFGSIAILFFGGIGISAIRKVLDKKFGLIINEKGIWDNSSGVSVGFIAWEDILGIRKVSVSGTRFLLIDVRNPDQYISNAKSRIKRVAMHANKKKYGTPISISAGGLKTKFNKLETQFLIAFKKYK